MVKHSDRKKGRHKLSRGTEESCSGLCHTGWWPILVLFIAGMLAYSNSFRVPFIFDDLESIPQNSTITNLARLDRVLSPPPRMTVTGRPLLNLSLAINYAGSNLNVWSYHLLNILIHVGVAIGLMQIGMFALSRVRAVTINAHARGLGFAAALLWLVHPLQTESVTYVIQRAESLVGLFYVWTIYCVARSEVGSRRWQVAAILLCAMGMASKEVMATAPLMALLFDRAFMSGNFREAWRQRKWLHGALWGTILIALALNGRGRSGSAGFGEGLSALEYARTQVQVIVHYMRLCLWPHPLVIDYHWKVPSTWGEIVLPGLVLMIALGAGLFGLWRNHPAGFLAGWFFLILAPSSSVIPIVTQLAAEHRMYLSSAAVVMLVVIVGHHLIMRWADQDSSKKLGFIASSLTAVFLCGATIFRNHDYRSAITIWKDATEKRPNNPRAHYNLGKSLEDVGDLPGAVRAYNGAVALKSDYVEPLNNLSAIHGRMGDLGLAKEFAYRALKVKPDWPQALNNLGMVLSRERKLDEAKAAYEKALKSDPTYSMPYYNLANLMVQLGKKEEAVRLYQKTVEIEPRFAEAHLNLAITFEEMGRSDDAVLSYRKAIVARPNYAKAHGELGKLLSRMGRESEAAPHLQRARELSAGRAQSS